ncbi:MAG TPA: hypothetical protein VEF91_07150 [Verrucomicrobiae bacterium]|nr:hypothetical protein [Verrucomicrobiae bacterium]
MHKSVVLEFALTALVLTALFAVTSGNVSVGVKKGNWIEYQVNVTGNPPPRYNVTWASINVTSVQGENLGLYIETRFTNGSYLLENINVNLETKPGDSFIVPSNLNVGDEFYNPSIGNITISSVEQRTVLGAERTIVSAVTQYTTYYWDRQTGILVQATTTAPAGLDTGFGISQGFTVYTKTSGTNIWQPQILGLDLSLFYALIVTAVVVVATIAAILVWRQRTISKRALS